MVGRPRVRSTAILAIGLALAVLISLPALPARPALTATSFPPARAEGGSPSLVGPSYFSTGLNASTVLGKPNFTSSPALATGATLCGANALAFDATGDLWVADTCDNRVVEYRPPFASGMAASVVLGQPNLSASAPASGPRGLDGPRGIAFDRSGDLWVADAGNDRVVEYAPPFSTGMAASLVLGQTSMNLTGAGNSSASLAAPFGVAVDPASGALWVSDLRNNRLVEFAPPFSTGMAASVVLGQSGFGQSQPGTGPNRLDGPVGIAFNATGAMWVGDASNNRVVAYDPPFATGESAALVLGQPNATASAPHAGGGGLAGPSGLSFDARGDLWVGDSHNNRVLEFVPPIFAGASAALVLGQPTATDRTPATSAVGMSGPADAVVGPGGALFVAEIGNARVTGFAPPFSSGMAADLVLGQANLSVATTAPTAANLGEVGASAVDARGDLWVLDTSDNRVVEFAPPFSPGSAALVAIGQPTLNDSLSGSGAGQLDHPQGLAFGPNGSLWVADTYNDRILEFLPPFSTGMVASVAIGQPNRTGSAPGLSARALDHPTGIAVDAAGDLWVADTGNNRVLEFRPPFATGMPATLVLGQSGFTSGLPGFDSPTGLASPSGVAVDANGTLYVSDTGNNRVLAFAPPFSTGQAASGVLGQTNLYSGGAGAGPGGLLDPSGIAVDPRGALWVADAGNDRVVRYSLPVVDGAPATVALGQPSLFTTAPGTNQSALRAPRGATVDPGSGGLWIADAGNRRMLFVPGNAFAVAGTTLPVASLPAEVKSPSTWLNLTLEFSSANGPWSVITQHLAAPAPDVPAAPFANASYFDVAVAPAATGFAHICVHLPEPALILSAADYYNGSAWLPMSQILTLGGLTNSVVCASLPLAALRGTPLAFAATGSGLPSFPSWYLFVFATIGFVAAAAVAIVVYNLRQRRRPPAPAGSPAAPPDGGGASGPLRDGR